MSESLYELLVAQTLFALADTQSKRNIVSANNRDNMKLKDTFYFSYFVDHACFGAREMSDHVSVGESRNGIQCNFFVFFMCTAARG